MLSQSKGCCDFGLQCNFSARAFIDKLQSALSQNTMFVKHCVGSRQEEACAPLQPCIGCNCARGHACRQGTHKSCSPDAATAVRGGESCKSCVRNIFNVISALGPYVRTCVRANGSVSVQLLLRKARAPMLLASQASEYTNGFCSVCRSATALKSCIMQRYECGSCHQPSLHVLQRAAARGPRGTASSATAER